MGGCRCAYKNCTLRTDGVTHMFHFPVFDKFRCHQWLTNAEKLEFLNLKVSQLKNRVICQHHFQDDNFMNFRKDKLTFDAVPTEDGPFCDSSQLSDKTVAPDDSKLYSISLEDIETEYLTFNDKKANFSVKYGDFLTNCDMMDLDSFNLNNDSTHTIKKDKHDFVDRNEIILNENIQGNLGTVSPVLVKTHDALEPKSDNIYTIQMVDKLNDVNNTQASLMIPINNPIPNISPTKEVENEIPVLNKAKQPRKKKSGKTLLKDRKITILNEEKVSQPVPLPQSLELVSPNTVLPLPNKRKNLNANLTDNNNMHNISNNVVAPDHINHEPNNVLQEAINVGKDINLKAHKNRGKLHSINNLGQHNNEIRTNVNTIESPKGQDNVINRVNTKKQISLLKNKMPPEKKAAIEEKRKFNIKLRDIISSCLDKLEDQEDREYNSKLKSQIGNNITQKVTSYLAKEPELPSVPDYTVAYLEARIKKMENILLHKIDQNTQRIVELKQSILPGPDKKAVHTQTAVNEEIKKKQLYQDISKYLSPEANSLLYEELFINRHVQKVPQRSPTKKRKHR